MRRSNIELHPDFDYGSYSDSELYLAHTVVHNLFSVDKKHLELLVPIHRNVVSVMLVRGLKHSYFDKLDDKLDKI